MENRRTYEIFNVKVHRASYVKHLRSKKHFENEMVIPEWLLKEEQEEQSPIMKQIKNLNDPKTLKQIARENFKLDDKKLDEKLAKK